MDTILFNEGDTNLWLVVKFSDKGLEVHAYGPEGSMRVEKHVVLWEDIESEL
jgi:hypothetical protein